MEFWLNAGNFWQSIKRQLCVIELPDGRNTGLKTLACATLRGIVIRVFGKISQQLG